MIIGTRNQGQWINQAPELHRTHRYVLGPAIIAGGQHTGEGLRHFLTGHPQLENVIRLDAEAKALSILDTAAEAHIVEVELDRSYHYFNIEGHGNKLNEPALARCDAMMDAGGCYVHCRNGRHRAMVIVGRYYVRQGYDWGTIIDLLDWHQIQHDKKYARYVHHLRTYYEGMNHLRERRRNFS